MSDPHIHKDLRKLAKRARRLGWRIVRTAGSHTSWISPDGQAYTTSGTPSDSHSVANHLARLRKAGLK